MFLVTQWLRSIQEKTSICQPSKEYKKASIFLIFTLIVNGLVCLLNSAQFLHHLKQTIFSNKNCCRLQLTQTTYRPVKLHSDTLKSASNMQREKLFLQLFAMHPCICHMLQQFLKTVRTTTISQDIRNSISARYQ